MPFVNATVDWYISTLVFYLCIIVACYVLTAIFQNKILAVSQRKFRLWVIFTFGILLWVKGFGTTGRDLRGGYYLNFNSAVSMASFRDQTIEAGYRLLNVIIRNITDHYEVFTFIVACLTLFPVIWILKKYQNRIDLPVAVLMYVSIFFFSSFSLLRQAIAAAFCLVAFDSMVEKKPLKALIWVAIASLFHVSALVILLPLISTQIKLFNKTITFLGVFSLVVTVILERNSIVALLADSSRYANYSAFETVRFGFEQIAYYAPLFYVFYKGRKVEIRQDKGNQFAKVSFSYLIVGFCFGLLGYVFSIFGRFSNMFLPLIVIIPYYLKLIKQKYSQLNILINTIVVIYCLLRFYIYISQYYNLEDIMPYTNIFGWKI